MSGYGDGVANVIDALLVAKCYVGLIEPQAIDTTVADTDCNDQINIFDALLIAQYYVDVIPELSCCGITYTTWDAMYGGNWVDRELGRQQKHKMGALLLRERHGQMM